MGGTPAPKPIAQGESIQVSYAVIPEAGEDSFAFHTGEKGGFLFVADGCGGLGAKRYAGADGRTGAHLAAKLAERTACQWVNRVPVAMPQTPKEGSELCTSLAKELGEALQHFEAQQATTSPVRIVGRMQKALPTTLCLALLERKEAWLDGFFLWAGDSRGYLLDARGLHQITEDHVVGGPDAMENLYRDAPLSNLASAEAAFTFSARRVQTALPSVALVATDGAFAYLPTPMEFEWLLLSTLHGAKSLQSWQRKLQNALGKVSADDCTLLLALFGFQDIEQMKAAMEPRRLYLQRNFITPVRRRKQDRNFARQKWVDYRMEYDWTEGASYGETNWRI